MKEGWEYKKLEDCFISINNGANIRQVKGAKGIPVTRIETLSNDKFNRERMGYADILDASPYSSYILNDGDILMSHINSMKFLGRAVQYSKKGNETIIHGMNLLRLVPTKDVLSSFLVYQFYTAFFRNQIVSISHQSVNQASFNTTNLKNLKLKVPTLSEQQSIVEYLDSAFAKVDAMKANAEKALNEAKALFQASLKEMLEPKEGWKEKMLGDVCVKSKNIRWEDYQEGKFFTYIDLSSVDRETLTIIEPQFIDKKNAPSRAKQIVKAGDVIFATTRPTLRRVCLISEDFENQICSTGFCILRPNEEVISKWFFYSLLNEDFYKYIEPLQTGANYPAVTDGIVKKYSIFYPSLAEQQSIVTTLDSLKSKVDRLQENYNKISLECDALKQAILRQVFE